MNLIPHCQNFAPAIKSMRQALKWTIFDENIFYCKRARQTSKLVVTSNLKLNLIRDLVFLALALSTQPLPYERFAISIMNIFYPPGWNLGP